MSAKGGYQILDLSNYTLGNPMEIKGIYDIIEGNTAPLYVSGVKTELREYKDQICNVHLIGTAYAIEGVDYIIYIEDTDVVHFFRNSDSSIPLLTSEGNCNALAVYLYAIIKSRLFSSGNIYVAVIYVEDSYVSTTFILYIIYEGTTYVYSIDRELNTFTRSEI